MISGDLDHLVANIFRMYQQETFYRRTGRQKRIEQKQIFIKP